MSSLRIIKGNSRKIALSFAGLALGILATVPGSAVHGRSALAVTAVTVRPAHPVDPRQVTGSGSTGGRTAGHATGHRANAPPVTLVRYVSASYHRLRHAPRSIARQMLSHYHWGPHQFRYLDWLWSRESGWNRHAANPYSGAYGIPQAVPGRQMASAGRGWRWNAHTQIRWGLRYIRERYGSPRRAWAHECGFGWY